MALQQCLSRGRKVVLTNLLPKSSTQFRHLFSARLLDRTHVQNNVNGRLLTYAHQKNSSIVCTKWHCFQTLSCNYSKMDKDREFLKSSVVQDIDDIDDDGDDDDDDDGDDYVDDADQNAISHMERTKIEFQLDKIFDKKEMSSKEWEETIKLMSRVNPFVSARTCDAITMKKCLREENYSLATSYMEHLQRQGCEPNLSTLGNYLQLCGRRVDQCGEDRVLELYRKLMRQVKVLDVRLAKNVILSLTATREWRKALDHLFQLRKMVTSLEDVYSAIITAAFRAGEYELGWQYLADLREQNQIPLDSVFLEWVKQCEVAESKADREAMALTLLRKLESHEMYPSVDVMREITQLFRDGLGWSAHYLKLNRKGVCPACRHQLETKAVSEEEFRNLQEEFVPRVLVRSDIFRSTNPEEWEDFKQYVEERKPFSLVVDGLNASYILNKKGEHFRHKSLEEVVTQALQNESRSRILVLGRQHMQKWMKRMRWNRQRVDFYTLNNMTKDDGFFLYAALQSGLGTKFVTNDMLRDHLFRLGEVPLRDAFRRWQRTHQVMAYSSAGCVRLVAPAKFTTVAQEWQAGGESGWHVPYDDGAQRQSYEVPPAWLCLHPSLALPSPPLHVSLEPLPLNRTKNTTNPYQRLIPTKDSSGGMLKQKQRRSDEMDGPSMVKNLASNVPTRVSLRPSQFPPKRRKSEKAVGKVNLNSIFSDDKSR